MEIRLTHVGLEVSPIVADPEPTAPRADRPDAKPDERPRLEGFEFIVTEAPPALHGAVSEKRNRQAVPWHALRVRFPASVEHARLLAASLLDYIDKLEHEPASGATIEVAPATALSRLRPGQRGRR